LLSGLHARENQFSFQAVEPQTDPDNFPEFEGERNFRDELTSQNSVKGSERERKTRECDQALVERENFQFRIPGSVEQIKLQKWAQHQSTTHFPLGYSHIRRRG
jgi:hypothetical protein